MKSSKTKNELQKEVLNTIKNIDRCSVDLSVGAGKTLIGLKHLNSLKGSKYLIVAPKVSIFMSWRADATKFKLDHLLKKITFSTYLSLNKQLLDYDCVIFDEIHSLTFKHNLWLNAYSGKILGLTGTRPNNPKNIKSLIINKYAPFKYTYSTDEAVDDSILNDYVIHVHELELSTKKNIKRTKFDKSIYYTSERDEYNRLSNKISMSNMKEAMKLGIIRMRFLQKLESKEILAKELLDKSENKCILFANTQEQADSLCLRSYHSNNPNSERNLNAFKVGAITKLSCVEQLSEGINIPNLKEGIIMHFFSINSPKSKQKLGRLLRLLPNDKCILHILYYKDTVDEINVKEGLKQFNKDKIVWK